MDVLSDTAIATPPKQSIFTIIDIENYQFTRLFGLCILAHHNDAQGANQ